MLSQARDDVLSMLGVGVTSWFDCLLYAAGLALEASFGASVLSPCRHWPSLGQVCG
jgi:hypothetical protein